MARSKSVLQWCFRAVWGEDPALRRIRSLEASLEHAPRTAIPVFAVRAARRP